MKIKLLDDKEKEAKGDEKQKIQIFFRQNSNSQIT